MSAGMRKRVDSLYAKIKSANEELDRLRATCPHELYRVCWYSWRVGSVDAKRLCKQCDEVVGDPTDEERAALGPMFPRPAPQVPP